MQLRANQKSFLALVAIFCALLALDWTGFFTSVIPANLGGAFIPCGLAVACFLRSGFRLWPVVWLAGVLFLLSAGLPQSGLKLATLLGDAAWGASLWVMEALLVSYLLRQVVGHSQAFTSMEEAFGFLGIAALCCTFAVLCSMAGAYALGRAMEGVSWRDAVQLWLADFTSVVVIPPTMLAFLTLPRRLEVKTRWAEGGTLVSMLLLLCLAFFSPLREPGPMTSVFIFLLLPLHLWAALRFRTFGLMLSVLPVAGTALWLASAQYGIFGGISAQETKIIVHIYMAVMSITGLCLLGSLAARDLSEQASAQQAKQYQSIFENSAVPLCEQNWQMVRQCLADMGIDSGAKLECYCVEHPDFLEHCLDRVKTVDVNQAMIDLFQVENKGQLLAELTHYLAPESIGVLKEVLRVFISGGFRFRGEVQLISRHGERLYAIFDAICLPGSEQSLERVIFSLFDCTAAKANLLKREKAEGELLAAKETAEKANRAKSLFLANMSHEIRTPVSIIMGYSEMLQESDLSKEETSLVVDTIVRNGAHLLQLIDDVLDLSKVEAGRLKLRCTSLTLKPFLEEVKRSLQLIASAKRVNLTFTQKAPLPETIVSDATRCRQILFNLVDNAAKFTAPGGMVHVEVSLLPKSSQQAAQLSFLVRDSGCGIAREHQSKLFIPFSQGDASYTRQHGGTGLGLALARRLARELGGDVRLVHSEVGFGTIFCWTLALAPSEAKPVEPERRLIERQQALAEDGGEANALPLRNLRLLVAEDQPELQHMIKRQLGLAGAQVDVASNGQQALEMSMLGSYHAVIMDIQMPVLDGYGAVGILRQRGYQQPVIALTAHAMSDERDRCLLAGYNAHLAKPVSSGELINTILRQCGTG